MRGDILYTNVWVRAPYKALPQRDGGATKYEPSAKAVLNPEPPDVAARQQPVEYRFQPSFATAFESVAKQVGGHTASCCLFASLYDTSGNLIQCQLNLPVRVQNVVTLRIHPAMR
jgi:hypothetical protein